MGWNEGKRYVVHPLRSLWIVFRKSGNDEMKVGTYQTKEEAQRVCDKLNGRESHRNPDSWFEFFMNSFNK